jgi:perosamine synthetase
VVDLFKPYVPKNVREAVYDILGERNITQGPKVEEFERKFCKHFGLQEGSAATVNSGTAALELAYELLDLKPGAEVITTPLTCTATNLPLVRMGVKIVWADILASSLCIDPIDVRAKMTEKTKAVVQVHLGGIKADVGHLHVPVVSDAAQALGIFTGDFTCCSFQAIKHLTTVDGGMLVCDKLDLAKKAKLLRWFGIDRTKKMPNNPLSYKNRMMTYDIELPGSKKHMNDVNATMGVVGLDFYNAHLQHRMKLFNLYRSLLWNIGGIRLVGRDNQPNSYWLATVLVEKRDEFAKMLFEADIDCHIVQARNDTYKIFGGKREDLPVMNAIEGSYLSLPIGMHVSEEDVHYICNQIKGGW